MKDWKQVLLRVFVILAISSLLMFAGCTEESQDDTDAGDSDSDVDNNETVAAIVNGVEITTENVSSLQQNQEMSKEKALENLITQELLNQESQEYKPTDNEALIELENMFGETNLTVEDAKDLLLTQYGMTFEGFKERLATQNYLDAALEKGEINVTDDEALIELENMLGETNLTVEDANELLTQYGMTFEGFKEQLAQQKLIEQLREEADIQYN